MADQDPCAGEVLGEEGPTTYCDRDRKNNVWVQGADENGAGGVCLLDTMTESQVVYSLQRDPKARADLKRVTSNADLLALADAVPTLDEDELGDGLQSKTNRNADSIPFYSIFKGQPPFAQ